jgi:arylsulfatase A-like enzyme
MATRQGFDTFFGYYHQVHAHSYYPAYLWRDEAKYFLPGNSGRESDGLTGDDRVQYTHDEIHTKVLDFIHAHRDKPFFCYVPYTIPDTELLVPHDSLAEYAGQFPEPNPYVTPAKPYQDQLQPRAALAAMIARMDRSVGQILTLLQRLHLDERTIVFFTSDNGAPNGGGADLEFFRGNMHLRGTKGTMYEGGIRVPMIVRWPGRIPANSTSDQPWYFPDVLPTLAELAGASEHVPPGIEFMYWELGSGRRLQRAVRMGHWKAVQPEPGKPVELYDLQVDEGETRDVAKDHPEILAKIQAYLETCRTEPRPQEEPGGTGDWRFR